MSNRYLVAITLRGTAAWVCSRCGIHRAGGRAEVSCDTIKGIEHALHRLSLESIPVGWSAYGATDVRCESCKS